MTNFNIQSMWVAPTIPGVRNCEDTYSETPFETLPILNVADDLSWLTSLHPTIEQAMIPFRPEAKDRQQFALNARNLFRHSEALGVNFPNAFTELFQPDVHEAEKLQDCIPSSTACYFALPEKLTEAPFGLGGHLVPFLHDQQSCVVWYLLLPRNGAPYVLASYPVDDDEVGQYYLNSLDDTKPDLLKKAMANTRIVARSFSEFLYRYWLENSLFFKISHQIELTPIEKRYVENLNRLP